MTIQHTSRLTDEQIQHIRELEKICTEADHANPRISLDNGINYVREMDCFFLMYEDDALLGLISVFAPMQDVGEISACVHPAHRRQCVFRGLLSRTCDTLQKYGYEKLLFVHEASGPDGRAIAHKWGLEIEHSEYLLHYGGGVSAPETGGLEVRPAREDDIPEMAQLSAETFGESPEEACHLVESAFLDENRQSYAAFLDGKMVGLGGVNTGEPELYLFGLGISPRHQNKGLGRRMLAQLIRAVRQTDSREIVLEVDSENARAFHLYTTSGFAVRTQYDYYEAKTADFVL